MRITWFGHSAFRVELRGARILIDPFLSQNPSFGGSVEAAAEGCTHVLLTHGHDDHVGDAAAICRQSGAQLVGSFEVCTWLAGQGAANVNPGNIGGTVACGDFTVSFVNALHSSSAGAEAGPVYLGNPMGLILKAEGEKVLYHLGDTDIFGDMALIAEIHRPQVGLVPIGDRFTMGARTAALACRRFFRFSAIVPTHYATFPLLDPSAEKFRAEMGDDAAKVLVPQVGAPFEL